LFLFLFLFLCCVFVFSQTKAKRDLRYASTISFERRAREWDEESLTQEKLLAEDQRAQDVENRPKTYVCVCCYLYICLPLCLSISFYFVYLFICYHHHYHFPVSFVFPVSHGSLLPCCPVALLPCCPVALLPCRYKEFAVPMQSTYDKIVENSLGLLRGMSLDERAAQLREQFKAKEVSARVHVCCLCV
jgi:hypothetical protein